MVLRGPYAYGMDELPALRVSTSPYMYYIWDYIGCQPFIYFVNNISSFVVS